MLKITEPEKVFLSAEWQHLVILNYAVDPSLLQSHVPRGTSLDSFGGKTYLSLVGFRFSKTKLFGKISVPFHSEFEEVNLRFYVSRKTGAETRRGVVFIKEIVPKPAIALAARLIYGENYVSLPMKHKIMDDAGKTEVEYSWKYSRQWMRLFACSAGVPVLPAEKNLEQYITEHYWGYSRQRGGHTVEYHVTHASWQVRIASEAGFDGHAAKLYGKEFGQVLSQPPDSAYIADGSPVNVFVGSKIE